MIDDDQIQTETDGGFAEGQAVVEAYAEAVRSAASAEVVGAEQLDDKYSQAFERQKVSLERRRQLAIEDVEKQRARVEGRKQAYAQRTTRPAPEGHFEMPVQSAERVVARLDAMLEFARPSSEQDVAYRQRVTDELAGEIFAAAPPELPLRFHGTSIYFARDILESRGLSSSVDRLGSASSEDAADQVSVSIPKTIQTSIDYIDLHEEGHCIPPGCIFVLLPASAEEARAGSASLLMRNVDFGQHPEQLFGIMTAPENIDRVRAWTETVGLSPDLVSEFFEFTERLRQISGRIKRGEETAQQYVAYDLTEAD